MIFVIIGILILIVVIFVVMYNSLIVLKNNIDNAWAQIDVQLKRRTDLIPNLVETVKGYMKHERKVFIEVTKARTAVMNAKTPGKAAEAEGMLTGALKSLFAVAENYPNLKANENFLMLQEELSGTESKIAYARQLYNDSVLKFNQTIKQIPWNTIAGRLNFKEREYFEIEEKERKAVKVKFE